MTDLLLVCAGAAVGAPARYLMDRAIQRRHDTELPWGTIMVNLTGSFVLGILMGVSSTFPVPGNAMLLLGTGLCGTFTTYSSFAYETFRLGENTRWLHVLGNVTTSIGGGLGVALLGYTVGGLL